MKTSNHTLIFKLLIFVEIKIGGNVVILPISTDSKPDLITNLELLENIRVFSAV